MVPYQSHFSGVVSIISQTVGSYIGFSIEVNFSFEFQNGQIVGKIVAVPFGVDGWAVGINDLVGGISDLMSSNNNFVVKDTIGAVSSSQDVFAGCKKEKKMTIRKLIIMQRVQIQKISAGKYIFPSAHCAACFFYHEVVIGAREIRDPATRSSTINRS